MTINLFTVFRIPLSLLQAGLDPLGDVKEVGARKKYL